MRESAMASSSHGLYGSRCESGWKRTVSWRIRGGTDQPFCRESGRSPLSPVDIDEGTRFASWYWRPDNARATRLITYNDLSANYQSSVT